MSDPRRINVVCEGPTDFIVIKSVLRYVLKERDFIPTQIQPETSRYAGSVGVFGGGWKGVRAWCESMKAESGCVSQSSAMLLPEILVIHVDAEVAGEREIECEKKCPLASDTVDALCEVILQWAGESDMPKRIILCIPSKNTEAWVFTALYPNHKYISSIECRKKPESLLIGKREKLVRKKGNKYDKVVENYEAESPRITENWGKALACGEARRFTENLQTGLNC
ncbi:MAG: hypothetical protein NTX50_16985 [Candidatus Sumerlaeota bacterium]|nr:hypothetical protein [Candidatus Sumerlaeota bacterium]